MQVPSSLFVAATLMLALAACSKPAEQQAAEPAPQANETAQNENAPGTTTTFEESTPEPRQ